MLCTRIHLAERRYSLPQESKEGLPPGIIPRPCILRNLSRNYNDIVTPRIRIMQEHLKKLDSKSNQKPSLVVFSLKMQPGIKTLAPDKVKRDPRKMPTFCEQYKHTKRVRSSGRPERPESDLFIRGIEIPIANSSNNSNNSNRTNPDQCDEREDASSKSGEYQYIPRELQIQLTDCCQCMRDFSFFQQDFEQLQKQQQEEQRKTRTPRGVIQKNEHRRQDEKLLSVNSNSLKIAQIYGSGFEYEHQQRRTPNTPRTRQIIKITMNSKKN